MFIFFFIIFIIFKYVCGFFYSICEWYLIRFWLIWFRLIMLFFIYCVFFFKILFFMLIVCFSFFNYFFVFFCFWLFFVFKLWDRIMIGSRKGCKICLVYFFRCLMVVIMLLFGVFLVKLVVMFVEKLCDSISF